MFTLQDALATLEGRKEFIVARYDGVVTINYVVQLPDSFDGIRVNFRGVTFDERTGEIISLPFHKFFNVNQTDETQWDRIKDCQAEVYEKLDGTLIHFFRDPSGKVRAATRMRADTPQAKQAVKLVGYETGRLISQELEDGFTPCFEYVGPENQIVVAYQQPRLVYLGSRHRATGEFRFSGHYHDRANREWWPFSRLLELLRDAKNFEGYVCHLDNGLWVKAKCNWYLERHRAVDALMRPAWKLYEAVYDGVVDDLIALAADQYKPELRSIYKEAQLDFLEESNRLEYLADKIRKATHCEDERAARKAFALHVQANHSQDMAALMALYCRKSPNKIIQERLVEGYKVTKTYRLMGNEPGDC